LISDLPTLEPRSNIVTAPAHTVDEDVFEDGKMFDGSSIASWKGINVPDMILMPDPETACIDPFFSDPTLVLRCNFVEPSTMQGYAHDLRTIAERTEEYMKSTGIADTAYFGPEPEFFLFDDVRCAATMNKAFHEIDSDESS
jgi:glutamine synthetase